MIEHKWKCCLPRKSKTIQNENAITNSHLKHLIFKTTNIYIVPSFVFPTHFLFGREVVCEGFVFQTVTTFGAPVKIVFQMMGHIGEAKRNAKFDR